MNEFVFNLPSLTSELSLHLLFSVGAQNLGELCDIANRYCTYWCYINGCLNGGDRGLRDQDRT